jgi:hypothetical protein
MFCFAFFFYQLKKENLRSLLKSDDMIKSILFSFAFGVTELDGIKTTQFDRKKWVKQVTSETSKILILFNKLRYC